MQNDKNQVLIIAAILAVAMIAVSAAIVVFHGNNESGKEYKVTFDPNGEEFLTPIDPQTVKSGDMARDPGSVYNKDSTKFTDGWYTDKTCTQKYDFSSKVTQDLTLYAKWAVPVPTYTVTFDPNGEEFSAPVNPQTVKSGEKASDPGPVYNKALTKKTEGWYTDKACTERYDFSSKVTQDLTLYAKWVIQLSTVTVVSDPKDVMTFTYCIDGGAEKPYTAPIALACGHTLTVKASVPEEYAFDQWDDGTKTVTRTAVISEDQTWTAGAYLRPSITFHYDKDDTQEPYVQYFEVDKEFTLEANRYTAPQDKVFGWWTEDLSSGELMFYDCQKVIIDESDQIDVYAAWATVTTMSSGNKAYLYQAESNSDAVGFITGTAAVTQTSEGVWVGDNSVKSLYLGGGIPTINEAAFKMKMLTSLTIIDGVTVIGQHAFDTCTLLQYVQLGGSVTTIAGFAFNQCDKLEFLVMSANVESIGEHAFAGCEKLGNFNLPRTMNAIGQNAFLNCKSISQIDIPSGITAIGDHTFSGCESLAEVTIPDSVREIRASAFATCSQLTAIDIPAGVTKIGNSAFSSCTGLLSVTLPSAITELGQSCFSNCIGLTSMEIPQGITVIGGGAFARCAGLTEVIIPQTVNTIGSAAFNECTAITHLVFKEGFTGCANKDNMFQGDYTVMLDASGRIQAATDSDLEYRYFGNDYDTWEAIGTDTITFHYDKDDTKAPYVQTFKQGTKIKLKDNSFPVPGGTAFGWWTTDPSVDSIQYYDQEIVTIYETEVHLYAVWAQKTELEGDNIGYVAGTGDSVVGLILGTSEVTIGRSNNWVNENSVTWLIIGGGVPSVGESAFERCSSLKGVLLDGGVRQIGDYAFKGCYITDLDLGGATTISKQAFDGCQLLKNIEWGTGLKDIGDNAFNGCVSITAISLPGSVDTVGLSAFNNCTGLMSVTFVDGIQSIGKATFVGCSNLASVNFPASLTSIGERAFKDCAMITSVDLSAVTGITELGYGMFSGCAGLTSVTLPSTLTTIGDSVFSGCSFTSIDLPKTVTTIGDSAFSSTKLTKISLPTNKEFTKISVSMLSGCTELTSITIPDNVTVVERGAFSLCTKLATVVMSGNVTEIGTSAFNSTKISQIALPDTLRTIGQYCFQDCQELTSVTIPASVGSIGYKAFNGCVNLTTVVLKAGLKQPDLKEVFNGDYSQMVVNGNIANPDITDQTYKYASGVWTKQ